MTTTCGVRAWKLYQARKGQKTVDALRDAADSYERTFAAPPRLMITHPTEVQPVAGVQIVRAGGDHEPKPNRGEYWLEV